mmetsp:Transcript_33913/g.83146  ORF Transcript_33913/g.83146 Transcript_33913/m.83146 type:complete len:284 (-) Transcript_33913:21-872(-)
MKLILVPLITALAVISEPCLASDAEGEDRTIKLVADLEFDHGLRIKIHHDEEAGNLITEQSGQVDKNGPVGSSESNIAEIYHAVAPPELPIPQVLREMLDHADEEDSSDGDFERGTRGTSFQSSTRAITTEAVIARNISLRQHLTGNVGGAAGPLVGGFIPTDVVMCGSKMMSRFWGSGPLHQAHTRQFRTYESVFPHGKRARIAVSLAVNCSPAGHPAAYAKHDLAYWKGSAGKFVSNINALVFSNDWSFLLHTGASRYRQVGYRFEGPSGRKFTYSGKFYI